MSVERTEVDKYRSWCREHVRESPGFDLADAAIAKLEALETIEDGTHILVERIAELEALSNTSVCIFCGETMEKDWAVILDHAKGCEKRPENNLLKRAERAEAALEGRDKIIKRVRCLLENSRSYEAYAELRRWAARDE